MIQPREGDRLFSTEEMSDDNFVDISSSRSYNDDDSYQPSVSNGSISSNEDLWAPRGQKRQRSESSEENPFVKKKRLEGDDPRGNDEIDIHLLSQSQKQLQKDWDDHIAAIRRKENQEDILSEDDFMIIDDEVEPTTEEETKKITPIKLKNQKMTHKGKIVDPQKLARWEKYMSKHPSIYNHIDPNDLCKKITLKKNPPYRSSSKSSSSDSNHK